MLVRLIRTAASVGKVQYIGEKRMESTARSKRFREVATSAARVVEVNIRARLKAAI